MNALEKESMVPLYIQLAQSIERDILEGRCRPGSRIPSEAEYIKECAVSRVTVRQAMQVLLDRNLIVRRRGLGTFVQRKGVRQTIDELFGLYQSLVKKGLDPKMELLDYEEMYPLPEVRENLQLQPREKIVRFVRQFNLEDEVLVVSHMHIPSSLAGNWTREEAAAKNSFRLLEENAGIRIGNLQVRIRASVANARTAERLKVPRKSPVLELSRLAFSVEQKPVEYTILVFRGDSYELTTQIPAERLEQFTIGKSPAGLTQSWDHPAP